MRSDEALAISKMQRVRRLEAKRWLERVYYQTLRVEADARALAVIEGRVNNAVGKLDNDGASIDRSQSSKRREAALVDYAQKNEELEEETMKLEKLKKETRIVISKFGDEKLEKIAGWRYIDCLRWKDVEKIAAYSHPHMMRIQNDILNKVAGILGKEGVRR